MDRNYVAALAGALASSRAETTGEGEFTIENGLSVPLAVSWLNEAGAQWGFEAGRDAAEGAPGWPIPSGGSVVLSGAYDGYWWLLQARSGAFAALAGMQARPEARYTGPRSVRIAPADLVPPNALGTPPRSTDVRVVPGSSPRVLVGCGKPESRDARGAAITREQYWQLSGDSYSLAPGESRTISYTETTGMESTTSRQDTLAASLGVSASAGWGPISASVSASLSASSTTFQQVTLSSETTTFVSRTVENRASDVELVLVWQLIDVVTVFDAAGVPLASTISAVNPAIVQAGRLQDSTAAAPLRAAGEIKPPRVADSPAR